jgi:hypothetical protein
MLQEKNVPTDPKKWAKWIAQAKKKFDVYPSAYANGWAAKMYKQDGGGWKTMKESIMERYVQAIDQLEEGSRSSQGTLFQAIGMIDNSRYIKKGSVVGNNKTNSISFKMNDGTDITINNVVYKKDKRKFCYDEILGVEDDFNRTSDIINTLAEIGIDFNTDEKY